MIVGSLSAIVFGSSDTSVTSPVFPGLEAVALAVLIIRPEFAADWLMV